MEEKYYTPTIDEFHFGFEYEIFEDFDVHEEKSWHKQVYGINGYDQERIDHVSPNDMGKVRVKYLDHDDIVECGWASGGLKNCNFTKGNYILTYLDISYTEKSHKVNIQFCSDDNNLNLFYGTINNKSELKKLMKQLWIEK